eukprot:1152536-Pelagomonas_calceolata.AAC.3
MVGAACMVRTQLSMHACVNKACSRLLQEGPVVAPGTAYQCHLCVKKDWLRLLFSGSAYNDIWTYPYRCTPIYNKIWIARAYEFIMPICKIPGGKSASGSPLHCYTLAPSSFKTPALP